MRNKEEERLQINCVSWFRYQYPELNKLLFAIPNGGSRNVIEAKNLKRQGVVPGVSDLILLIGNKDYNSLCIEFKTDKGKQSDDQREFERKTVVYGNKYVICRDIVRFMTEINEYLNNK